MSHDDESDQPFLCTRERQALRSASFSTDSATETRFAHATKSEQHWKWLVALLGHLIIIASYTFIFLLKTTGHSCSDRTQTLYCELKRLSAIDEVKLIAHSTG